MIDIKFLRENPDIVKENIKNKFQEQKLVLVDEVIELDKKNRSKIKWRQFKIRKKKFKCTNRWTYEKWSKRRSRKN